MITLKHERNCLWAWISVLPVSFVLFLAIVFVAPKLATPPDMSKIKGLFLPEVAGYCLPEPLEHLRYVLAISVVPAAFLIFSLFYYIRGADSSKWLNCSFALTSFVQVGLIGFAGWLWFIQYSDVHPYFDSLQLFRSFELTAVLLLLSVLYLFKKDSFKGSFASAKKIPGTVAYIIALVVSSIKLMPSIYTELNLFRAHSHVWSHMGHTMGEFAGVHVGKTPLVDFFPQYQNILPFVLEPFYKIFGFSVLTYTLSMSLCSFLGLILLYLVFRMLTGSPWWALAFYLPLVGISFYPTVYVSPTTLANAFTYYAVWPLRYFWPCVVAFLFTRAVVRQTMKELVLLFFVAAVGAINNVDFGAPALVAGVMGLLVVNWDSYGLLLKSCGRILLWLLLSAFFAVSAISLLALARSGHWPQFSELITSQKIFALYGFYMLPAPDWGLHWVIYLTYVTALCLGVFQARSGLCQEEKEKRRIGLLVFSSIFGCGSFMYYIGRSHHQVLIAPFAAWAFCLMILLWSWITAASRSRKEGWSWRLKLTLIAPGLLLFFHYSIFATQLFIHPPVLAEEIKRFKMRDNTRTEMIENLVDFVQGCADPSEKVTLGVPYGDEVAFITGLRNVYPFPHPGNIILKRQVDQLEEEIITHNVRKVFTDDRSNKERIRRMLRIDAKLNQHAKGLIVAY